jgi:ribonuclease HII
MIPPFNAMEEALRAAGHTPLAGIDEVGRGALAGPVVAAAVVLNDACQPLLAAGVTDSKLLSARRREELVPLIERHAQAISLAYVPPEEIDRLNIREATRLAMSRAAAALSLAPRLLLIDGDMGLASACRQQTVVGGDRLCLSIAAASIVAKVARDRLMGELDRQYPGYGFAAHKGYGTAAHRRALQLLGPSPVHRRSFAPVVQTEFF